ncbi:transglycosylase SLT domain-containing protein [Rhizobium sp. CFBP 13726]|uniref:transglycosylase SLT domain-containing protein n=1 Tax=Rhizobium sp. CFBP 13726 TaxID=2775296 RepID=UPI0020171282|nr:transglycosylase SLT domain-containing protein [Rhizobium sp. CFBP 13726]
MTVVRFVSRRAAVALAMSSVLAGCSSVERDTKVASGQPSQTTSADGQLVIQYNSSAADQSQQMAPGQTMAQIAKSGRIAVPVPPTVETVSAQNAAMASPTMAPIVAFTPPPIATAVQPVSLASAQPLKPAAGSVMTQKSSRLVSPPVATAVASGQIQPAAAQAIALDEEELTPDMVALQSVVPTPRPATLTSSAIAGAATPAAASSTLAYAAAPRAVAAVSAMGNIKDFPPAPGEPMPDTASNAPADLKKLIKRYAGLYGVPESLVHRVVHRESKYNPKAYHKNGYWGLMQIKYSTAKSMGYQGKPEGLLDAETNLKYAIRYLRGAWLVADNKNDNAIRLYARGYYYDAKRRDMLHVLKADQSPTTPVAFATAPNSKPGS